MRTGVTAEFHRGGIKDFGQEDGLAFSDKVFDEMMGIDFVRQRVVGQDNPGIG